MQKNLTIANYCKENKQKLTELNYIAKDLIKLDKQESIVKICILLGKKTIMRRKNKYFDKNFKFSYPSFTPPLLLHTCTRIPNI